MFLKVPSSFRRYRSRPSHTSKHDMTTPTPAATLGVAPAHRDTTPTRGIAVQPRTSLPATVRNAERSTQSVRPPIARAPNAFRTTLDAMGERILEKKEVVFAIKQGSTAQDIAGRFGIRQGSDAFKTLVCRVDNQRIAVMCRSLGL